MGSCIVASTSSVDDGLTGIGPSRVNPGLTRPSQSGGSEGGDGGGGDGGFEGGIEGGIEGGVKGGVEGGIDGGVEGGVHIGGDVCGGDGGGDGVSCDGVNPNFIVGSASGAYDEGFTSLSLSRNVIGARGASDSGGTAPISRLGSVSVGSPSNVYDEGCITPPPPHNGPPGGFTSLSLSHNGLSPAPTRVNRDGGSCGAARAAPCDEANSNPHSGLTLTSGFNSEPSASGAYDEGFTSLFLSHNVIGARGAAALAAALASGAGLKVLNLNGNLLSAVGVAAFASALGVAPKLNLNSGVNGLPHATTDKGGTVPHRAPKPNLNSGVEGVTHATAHAAAAIAAAIATPAISSTLAVAASSATTTDKGGAVPQRAPWNIEGGTLQGSTRGSTLLWSTEGGTLLWNTGVGTLLSLKMSANAMCCCGAAALSRALVASPALSRLASLDLSHNGILAAGANALATALRGNCALTELSLASNGIGVYSSIYPRLPIYI